MTFLAPLLLSIQIQVVGIEVGTALYLPSTGFGPQAGLFYDHAISERFRICSGISYWTKKYRDQVGAVERNCVFSDLLIHEDGVVTTTFFDRLTLGAGAGMSLHLLKNYVKERTDHGHVIITDYYARTLNRLGLELQFLAELKVGDLFLALRGRCTRLLMDTNGVNLFYEVGTIRTFAATVSVGVNP